MKIGINAQKLMSKDTGVGIYTNRLIENIIAECQTDDFILFSSYGVEFPRELLRDGVSLDLSQIPLGSSAMRILWEQTVLPRKAKRLGCDVFHFPDHTASLMFGLSPVVITVHDLAFLRYPRSFDLARALYKKMVIKKSVEIADHIIAVSEFTQNEVVELLNIDPEKISIVYNGVSREFQPMEKEMVKERLKSNFGIEREYILFVGTLEPRKNIVALVHAYKRLLDEGKTDAQMVIVGGRGWLYDTIFREIEQLNIVEHVLFTGYVPQNQLLLLYNGATFLVYPALYEGFGLPVLEAMACGAPVITSNRSSFSEVAGEAAFKVNPHSDEEIFEAMAKLYSDTQLQEDYRQAGFERAAMFPWQNTAKRTLDVYRKVYENKKG